MKKAFFKTSVLTLAAIFALSGFVGCAVKVGDKKPSSNNNSTYNPNNGGSTGITPNPNPNPTPNPAPDDSETIKDGSIITVKCVRRGFGTDWLYELKEKFETLYADKGYKVNIMPPDTALQGDTLVRELAVGYQATQVDLYITVNATPDMVGAMGDYGILVEDIQDSVYNKPAISYDGTKEEVLISEKLAQEAIPYTMDSLGNTYGYNWAQSSGGMVVNVRKLAEYGLEIPKTTNEMFDCFDKIYLGHNGVENSDHTGTYPITYVSGNNGYTLCFLNTLLAQYDQDYYDKFWSFQTVSEDESVVNLSDLECMDTYNHPAMQEMVEIAYRTFDMKLAAPGSLSQGVEQAQAKILGDADGAVFMLNGDWMLNEVKLHYSNELHDIDFVNYPVVSALGVKLFGEGTSYGLNETECDELLSYIISHLDNHMEIDDIVAILDKLYGFEIAEEDVAEVARARGVSYSRGVEHLAYITKDTPNKALASLFLRMMSSDDFGRTFQEVANASTPYYAAENTTSQYAFVRNASKIANNPYYSLIASGAKGYRKQLNLEAMFTTQNHLPDYISSESTASIYTWDGRYNGNSANVYETAASNFLADEYSNLSKNWQSYKEKSR